MTFATVNIDLELDGNITLSLQSTTLMFAALNIDLELVTNVILLLQSTTLMFAAAGEHRFARAAEVNQSCRYH